MKKITRLIALFLITVLLIGSLTGCQDSETSKQKKTENPYKKLSEIRNDFVVKIWNDVFCDVSHYLYDGKDATGEYFDVDRAIKKADKLMSKKTEYDKYINGLGTEYSEIKEVWVDLSHETDLLYNQIKKEKPTAKNKEYRFETKKFRNYMEDFTELVNELK